MGNKDKKKHRYRSKERKSKRSKKERADNSPSRDSRSRSPVERKHLHKKSSHRRENRSDSESSDRSAGRSKSHRSRSHNKRKKRSDSSDSGSSDRSAERSKSHRSRSHNKRKKRSDSSESSLSDQSIERKLADKDRKKREEFLKEKEERRLQKELIKSLETPEEKRARRLAKKEAKERRRKEKMGWDKDYMGYTNVDNPFGDEHLLDAFVWEKKMGKDGRKDFTRTDMQKMANSKMGENRRELEKVKQRRLEREKELEERENERERLQREKEAEYFREWEKQEDSFHLSQAKLRSQIRIQDGRAKPIDLLAKYISAEDDELAIEMHEPYTYLHGLTIVDIEDLLEDIKVYLELEEGKNTDYWRDIVTVTEDELNKLRKMDTNSREYIGDRREGIHQAVTSEVNSVFKGKTTSQLRLLENQIKEKLKGGEGIDIGYWESLLQQLKAHMARTRLRERHQDVLRQKLHKLKQEQGIETGPLFPVVEMSCSEERQTDSGTAATSETNREMIQSESADTLQEQHIEEESEVLITEEDLEKDAIDEYIAGNYSPRLFQPAELDIDAIVYDTVDDFQKLELARTQVLTIGKVKLDAETEFEKAAREGMNDDEAQFSVELALDKQAFLWSDKYRPRKPRFFNRVHTGFEWNKYNQTHYDIDNPPPKIVQGYKFNIFYPDLIDKTDTPEYTVTPSDDNKDFAVLRFHSGPPYEDIAFKIVNREWEYSYKRGFRCQFQNNIFQLWFHFKRYRYRR